MAANLSGDFTNQGSVSTQRVMVINADTINNIGGQLSSDIVQLDAQKDVNNTGAQIRAKDSLYVRAGNDLNVTTTTRSSTNSAQTAAQPESQPGSRTDIDRVAGLYVDNQSQGALTLLAGEDINLIAAVVNNAAQDGFTYIDAGNDLNLGTVDTGFSQSMVADADNQRHVNVTNEVGTQISAVGDIYTNADNDINIRGAQIRSQAGAVALSAGQDVNITNSLSTEEVDDRISYETSGFLSSTNTKERSYKDEQTANASVIEGVNVSISSGRDTRITASQVVADQDVRINAARDVTIDAAQTTSTYQDEYEQKKSGLMSSGDFGVFIGKQQTNTDSQQTNTQNIGSAVGALDGNVVIQAARNYSQVGSDVLANTGLDLNDPEVDLSMMTTDDPTRGNVLIKAQDIDIKNTTDVIETLDQTKYKQTGITVSVSNSLVSEAQAIQNLAEASQNTDSDRIKAMAGVAGALKARGLAEQVLGEDGGEGALDALKSGDMGNVGQTRIEATIGSSKSETNTRTITEQTNQSSVLGNNISLIAEDQLTITGSKVAANNDLYIKATDAQFLAAQEVSQTRSDNESSGFGVGAYATTGEQSGAGITLNANQARGSADSDSVTYSNTTLSAGNNASLNIANDLTMRGASLEANRVQAEIGGDLTIESLQDTTTYESKQSNSGFSADIDVVGGNSSSVSVNLGKTDIDASHKAVNEQSGIFTGDGGFDITIGGKTSLTGGAITTTEEALAAGRNKFTSAGGITTEDITNTSKYEGESLSVGISAGGGKLKNSGSGYGTDDDKQTSTTKAGITGIAGHEGITTDNQDEYAGSLTNVFDANKVNVELGAQTVITKEFGIQVPQAVGDYASDQTRPYELAALFAEDVKEQLETETDPQIRAQLTQQLQAANDTMQANQTDYDNWKEGGTYRVAAHALTGLLGTGTLSGALTTGGVAAAAPTINDFQINATQKLIDSGMSAEAATAIAQGITSLSIAGAGLAGGAGTGSTVTAINVDSNNRQLHPREAQIIDQLAEAYVEYVKEEGISLEEAKRRLTRGALYNIDEGWKASIDNYVDDSEIADYQAAYDYLRGQTQNQSVIDMTESCSNAFCIRRPALPPGRTVEEGFTNQEIRENSYIYDRGKGFTASAEDLNNQEMFLNQAYGDDTVRDLYQLSSMKYGEDVNLSEAAAMQLLNSLRRTQGLVDGAAGSLSGTWDAAKTIANMTSDDWADAANAAGRAIEGAVVNAAGNAVDAYNDPQGTIDAGREAIDAAQEFALTQANLLRLKYQQNMLGDSSYEIGQAVGSAGTDVLLGGGAGRVVGTAGRQLDELGNQISDTLTPRPATVTGTMDGNAMASTGKPNTNSVGAPEAVGAGATLSVGDGDQEGSGVSAGGYAPSSWTQISSDALAVAKDIENATGLAISPQQRIELANQLREVDHRIPVSTTDYANLQREYRRTRIQIIRDWEANTGETWPNGAQLHHIIPQRYGGPNQWWNAHPALPSQHQGGIHGAGSSTQNVFPTPVPKR